MSRLTPGRAITWLAGATLIGGLSAHWLASSPESSEVLTPIREDGWRLPEIPPPLDMPALYAKLRQIKPWGDTTAQQAGASGESTSGTQAPDKKSAPAWRLSGIVSAGQERYILMLNPENQKVQRFALQDILPDQAQVRGVGADSVEIERGGQTEVWRLYQPYTTGAAP